MSEAPLQAQFATHRAATGERLHSSASGTSFLKRYFAVSGVSATCLV